jgi:hypothetical protein
MKASSSFILITFVLIILTACRHSEISKEQQITGYGFLSRIPGMWSGPVSSSTTAGSFPMWYCDFRPIGPAQVSQFSQMDTLTMTNVSFFIVKYKNQLRLTQRTEGCHNDTCCATYEVLDSASEANGYYHFSDFVRGSKRAISIYKFTGNQLEMKVYTNKFNKYDSLVWHSTWAAGFATSENAKQAITHFNFPQPVMTCDFTNAFNNMTESIFFNLDNDPYNSSLQPYIGNVTINISIAPALHVDQTDQVFLVFTIDPLFNGTNYIPANLKYISRYILLPVSTKSYTIQNVHPGSYYLYSLIDVNHDGTYGPGDYMSSDINHTFTVADSQNVTISTSIDMVIP